MTELLPDALNEWPLAARGRPCYLATAPDAVFAMLHAPVGRLGELEAGL